MRLPEDMPEEVKDIVSTLDDLRMRGICRMRAATTEQTARDAAMFVEAMLVAIHVCFSPDEAVVEWQ